MIEGRLSAGTTIGENTDIGAGAGFLGTLSGGNDIKLSTGKNCLIGANAECGAILGDNCIVATGTCFSQNTPIWYRVDKEEKTMKISDLNGKDNLIYRQNSRSGELEVVLNKKAIELNEKLHVNT